MAIKQLNARLTALEKVKVQLDSQPSDPGLIHRYIQLSILADNTDPGGGHGANAMKYFAERVEKSKILTKDGKMRITDFHASFAVYELQHQLGGHGILSP